jgi:hypothetical protein
VPLTLQYIAPISPLQWDKSPNQKVVIARRAVVWKGMAQPAQSGCTVNASGMSESQPLLSLKTEQYFTIGAFCSYGNS